MKINLRFLGINIFAILNVLSCSSGSSSNINNNYTSTPNVTISPIANWQTMMGSAYAIKASISNGSSTVTLTITGLGNSQISPESCALDSAKIESTSCLFFITPYTGNNNYSYWNPRNITNSIDITTPNSAYIQSNINLQVTASGIATRVNGLPQAQLFTISGSVIAPYIYLAAPLEGVAESNIGITWSSGSRFVIGSTGNGNACPSNETIESDTLTGLTWVANPTGNQYNWENALASVPTSYCGYSDWRLPTINELRSLVNYTANQNNSNPAEWLNSQGFINVQPGRYWSATSYDSQNAWPVYFNDGSNSYVSITDLGYVLFVRGRT